MEIAGAAIGGVVNVATGHAEREIGYLQFGKNVENLKIKARKLLSTRDDLQLLVDVAQCNGELIKKTVTDWLNNAEDVLNKVTELVKKAGETDKWHQGSRFSLGRKAVKRIAEIEALLDEKSKFESIAEPKLSQSLELVTSEDFDAFASRKQTTKEIFDALIHEEVKLVGVFGMPGVGKTMLMQAIVKQVKVEKQFQEIVIVTVSQKPDIRSIQKEIAAQMDLTLSESLITAAAQLSERLSCRKKILVALDDMWEILDFAKVGIPHKSNVQGCKVLLTTRRQELCDQMVTDANIEVKILSDEDSWSLFRKKAGDVIDSSSHQEIAHEVLNECKCLPIAIATLGLALRNKDIVVWRDALTQLRNSIYEDMEGMDVIISMVKLSYKFLQSETDRMCFLFCSLFAEDFLINTDYLLTYMLGEKLLKNVDTMEQARHRLHTIVGKLITSGLLLRNKDGSIKMHDVIRDAAIHIASDPEEGKGFIVKSGLGLTHWPDIQLEKCKRLSLMVNDIRIDDLPHKIAAPHLLTLSFYGNLRLTFYYSYFVQMENLRTLDLSWSAIRSLPPCFQSLENLCTLRMDHCFYLYDISPIENLERLEILTIQNSFGVPYLPGGMCKLSNLKIFDASMMGCTGTRMLEIPPNLISSLYRLEELYLRGRLITSRFQEIASLTRLSRLDICLPIKALSLDFWDLRSVNLSVFKITLSVHGVFPPIWTSETEVFSEIQIIDLPSVRIPNWLLELLERTDCLNLVDCDSIETVAELGTGLRNVEGNEALYGGELPHGFLCKLRRLAVSRSLKIRILVPHDLLLNLQNLEVIKIECNPALERRSSN